MLELFFPRYPKVGLTTYFQPRQLDPGSFRLETRDGSLHMVNRLSIELFRSRTTAEVEIQKWVSPAANPLRYEPAGMPDGVVYAGYTQHTTLELLAGGDATLGIWNLIQMPHAGEMIIPLYSTAPPHVYFGDIAARDLDVSARAIRWRMGASGEQKIGVRAVAATGRVGYRNARPDAAVLIVRNFAVDPSGEYVDVPWADPADRGYAVKACNVDCHWGAFSELEYHVPGVGQGNGRVRSEDVSQVWTFQCPQRAIDRVSDRLLDPES